MASHTTLHDWGVLYIATNAHCTIFSLGVAIDLALKGSTLQITITDDYRTIYTEDVNLNRNSELVELWRDNGQWDQREVGHLVCGLFENVAARAS